MRSLCCLLLLLLAWPAALHAQASTPPALQVLAHQVHADGAVELLIRCASPDQAQAGFALLGVGGAPLPPPEVAPITVPPSAVILLDAGPALESAGTPYSTRKRDALLLAELVLTRLPAASRLALVTTAPASAIPPVATGRAEVIAALRTLATTDLAAAPPVDAAAPLALAYAQLDAAPGPGHLLVITAEPARWAAATIPFTLIDLSGPDDSGAVDQSRTRLAYHTARSAELPALLTAVATAVDALVNQRTHLRLRLPPGALPATSGQLTIAGCGGSAALLLAAPTAPGWIWAGALGALALIPLAGLFLWRRRKAAPYPLRPALPHHQPPRPLTTPFRAAELPTDRHGPAAPASYRLIVSGPAGRAAHTLTLGQWAIGRDPACAIVIDHPLLSALHARLSIATDRIELTDLASTNGTAIGPARRRLAPDTPAPLDLDETFWLGPDIHATLEAADDHA